MRQAQTLNEAQFRRVLHYCRSRRHPVRDTTIFMVSFYAGLRAKEIASLKLGDVFDETGAVREQFILGVDQSKGGQRRTVYLNQRLRKALAKYAKSKCLRELDRPLFESQKGGLFQRQVALTLAVILQPKKRQTHTCKRMKPCYQHCEADVQYLADGLRIITGIQ